MKKSIDIDLLEDLFKTVKPKTLEEMCDLVRLIYLNRCPHCRELIP